MEGTFEVPQDATSHYLKLLTFRQFMRSQNTEDEELIRKFAPKIPVPEGWDVEDHLEDLRPGVWMRKGDRVIMVYGTMGMICACFGEMRKPDSGPAMEAAPFTSSAKEQSEVREDFSMVFPIFPPEDIPYRNEEDDEEKDNFDLAATKLEDFMTGCVEFMNASTNEDGSDASDEKKAKEAEKDLGAQKKDDQAKKDKNDDVAASGASTSGPSVSDFTAATMPVPTGSRF